MPSRRSSISKARATAWNKPCKLDPNNALAWARLAEIHMSFAELDEALEAAQKAVALDPNLSRTQTVLGFAYLTRVEDGRGEGGLRKSH